MTDIALPPPIRSIRSANRDFLRALGAMTIASATLESLVDVVGDPSRRRGRERSVQRAWVDRARELLDHCHRVIAAIPLARFTGSAAEHVTLTLADGTSTVADAHHLDTITTRLMRHQLQALIIWPADDDAGVVSDLDTPLSTMSA